MLDAAFLQLPSFIFDSRLCVRSASFFFFCALVRFSTRQSLARLSRCSVWPTENRANFLLSAKIRRSARSRRGADAQRRPVFPVLAKSFFHALPICLNFLAGVIRRPHCNLLAAGYFVIRLF